MLCNEKKIPFKKELGKRERFFASKGHLQIDFLAESGDSHRNRISRGRKDEKRGKKKHKQRRMS